jgi:hypothetical protein
MSNKQSITQLLVVCIDGSMNESIMNHNETKMFSYAKLNLPRNFLKQIYKTFIPTWHNKVFCA